MEEISEAIKISESIIKGLLETDKNVVMSNISKLASIVEKTMNDELIWDNDDLKNFNGLMKYILLSIENKDYNFGADVIKSNLIPVLHRINIKKNKVIDNLKISELNETTGKIKDQYTDFAYPNFWKGNIPSDTREQAKDKSLITGLYNLEYIQMSAFKKHIPVEELKVLVAGCGTGEGAIIAALSYPSTMFTFVDISPMSLKYVCEYIEELKIKNVEIIQADIMTMDLKKEFDIIISTGVIHHLSNPSKGVANLNKHLKIYGVLSAMVYGQYGRFEIELFQEALKTIMRNKVDFNQGIEFVNMFMKNVDATKNRMTNILWKEDLNKGEQHIVDLLLNVNENSYNIKSLNDMLKKGDMKLSEIIATNTFNPDNYVNEETLKLKFKELNYLEKCSIAELINGKISMHNFYAVKTENYFIKLTIDDLNSQNYYICKSPYLIKKIIIEGKNKRNYILINPTCVYEENNVNNTEVQIDDALMSFLNLCDGKNRIGDILKKLKASINEDKTRDFIRDAVNRRMLILVNNRTF